MCRGLYEIERELKQKNTTKYERIYKKIIIKNQKELLKNLTIKQHTNPKIFQMISVKF